MFARRFKLHWRASQIDALLWSGICFFPHDGLRIPGMGREESQEKTARIIRLTSRQVRLHRPSSPWLSPSTHRGLSDMSFLPPEGDAGERVVGGGDRERGLLAEQPCFAGTSSKSCGRAAWRTTPFVVHWSRPGARSRPTARSRSSPPPRLSLGTRLLTADRASHLRLYFE
jgi:hypothetical protein